MIDLSDTTKPLPILSMLDIYFETYGCDTFDINAWEDVHVICGTNTEFLKILIAVLYLNTKSLINSDKYDKSIYCSRERNEYHIYKYLYVNTNTYSIVECDKSITPLIEFICNIYQPQKIYSFCNVLEVNFYNINEFFPSSRERMNLKPWLRHILLKRHVPEKLFKEIC